MAGTNFRRSFKPLIYLLTFLPVVLLFFPGLTGSRAGAVPKPPFDPGLYSIVSASVPSQVDPSPLTTGVTKAQTKLPKDPLPGIGEEYLALGDSIAYGVGSPVPEQGGYAGLLFENYLKPSNPDLIYYKNFAVPGETSTNFIKNTKNPAYLSQLDRALLELENAAKAGRRVSPLTISIGGNDMLEARGKSPLEKDQALQLYNNNLQFILGKLTSATPGTTKIILTTYFNPFSFNTGGLDEETAWVRRFNEVIKTQAASYKVSLADFFNPIEKNEKSLTWITQGDVHPNSAGYTRLASSVWQAGSFDTKPPALSLSFSSLPENSRLLAGQRAVLKVAAKDEGYNFITSSSVQGAGGIAGISVSLDNSEKTALPDIPTRYTRESPGMREFSYLLDTGGLTPGKHQLHFEGVDLAGNRGTLDLYFEII